MDAAFQYRPRFVDIRVRPEPPLAGAASAPPRSCDHAGCRAAAVAPAPKDPRRAGERPAGDRYWFCRPHAAEYNRRWNFFAGMSEGEVRARLAEEEATGGRPTWTLHAGGRNREAAGRRGAFRDAFGLFAAEAAPAAADPRLGKLERAALLDLDLPPNAGAPAIRARYLELVKRCHPDANGGDRSAEHRLERVLRAYKTLRRAKLA